MVLGAGYGAWCVRWDVRWLSGLPGVYVRALAGWVAGGRGLVGVRRRAAALARAKDNPAFIIMPSDKNLGPAIMTQRDYMQKSTHPAPTKQCLPSCPTAGSQRIPTKNKQEPTKPLQKPKSHIFQAVLRGVRT